MMDYSRVIKRVQEIYDYIKEMQKDFDDDGIDTTDQIIEETKEELKMLLEDLEGKQ